jgi:hypothetical protein
MDKPPLGTPRYGDAQHHSNTLHGLDDLCKKYINKETVVLELGSHRGVSTSLFCYYAKYVVAIDWNKTNGMTELIKTCTNLLFKKADISAMLPTMVSVPKLRFDFIYIDTEHDYDSVKRDVELSMPLLKEGGIISGHDYGETHVGVVNAVRERWPDHEIEVFKDTSWVITGEKVK